VRCRSLEGLVGDLVGPGHGPELGQSVGDSRHSVEVSQHTDCRLSRGQFTAETLLVGVGQPQPLVVQCPGRGAAEDTRAEAHRATEKEDTADSGAFASASCAYLVLLQLPRRIEYQNSNGIACGDPGVLQRDGGAVGGGLVWEGCEYELPI